MRIKDDEKIQIKNSTNRIYNSINFDKINNIKCRISYKFLFSFFFVLIILYFVSINLNDNHNELSRKSIDNNQNEKKFLDEMKSVLDNDEFFENEMMNKHTTFQLGGPAKFFTKPKSINKIIKIIQLCKRYSIEYFILGNGSNLLVSDQGFDGLIINILEDNFSDIKVERLDEIHYKLIVGGGVLMRTLAKRLCLLSLSGLEDIIDIPGTIGGGIIMNASAGGKGLIFNSLEKVKIITNEGEIRELSKKDCQLRHRGSLLKDNKYLVIEATFNLLKTDKMIIQKAMADHTSLRYSRQPMYFLSAGSFFIWNKPKFGSLYKKYKENNLMGYKVGDAMIYTHNIAFIVNLGNAKSSDVYKIVTHVEAIIKSKYNINIKREVVVLGYFS